LLFPRDLEYAILASGMPETILAGTARERITEWVGSRPSSATRRHRNARGQMAEQARMFTSLGATARWTAAVRALENSRADTLCHHPWAAALAGEGGMAWLGQRRPVTSSWISQLATAQKAV
jgi:hypothetical protein